MASFDLEPVFEGEGESKGVERKSAAPPAMPGKPGPAEAGSAAPAAQSVPSEQPIQKQPVPAPVPAEQPIQKQTAPVVVNPAQASPVLPVPAADPGQRSLLQIAAPSSVSVGQQFSLDIMISNVNDLANAPFVLTYDPALVEFVEISEGTIMKKDGKPITFSSVFNTVAGSVAVMSGRTGGSGGVSGSGKLATASFRAISRGSASFAFKSSAFKTSNGTALNVLPFSTAVDIR
jgi:general secretion pathway protein D